MRWYASAELAVAPTDRRGVLRGAVSWAVTGHWLTLTLICRALSGQSQLRKLPQVIHLPRKFHQPKRSCTLLSSTDVSTLKTNAFRLNEIHFILTKNAERMQRKWSSLYSDITGYIQWLKWGGLSPPPLLRLWRSLAPPLGPEPSLMLLGQSCWIPPKITMCVVE